MFKYLLFNLIFSLLILSGCATSSTAPQSGTNQIEHSDDKGWWFAAFHPHWPENSAPLFHIDALIADSIIAPVLKKHRQEIALWRFHRRASRNSPAKHRFTFLFYSTKETARMVLHEIETSSELQNLLASGTIDRIDFDNTDTILRPEIEQTSDHNWPPAIQKSWPYYIMGISEMWLDLIQQARLETVSERSASPVPWTTEDQYRQINQKITQLWKEYGQHAFLHHLNALFGYESMILREKRLIRF